MIQRFEVVRNKRMNVPVVQCTIFRNNSQHNRRYFREYAARIANK